MNSVFILINSLVISTCVCSFSDLTRENDASGAVVVDSVISKLRRSCLFDDHLLYLRRKAYVDTHDGTNPYTFVMGFQGGIWKIDVSDFNATKTERRLQTLRDQISQNFAIRWDKVAYDDLRKPLYSAIASELSAILKSGSQGIPITTEAQASFWANGTQLKEKFINETAELEKGIEFAHNVDIVFVLDSSASMSPMDLERSKQFVSTIVQGLDTDSGKVQVAVVVFSTVAYPKLALNNFYQKHALLNVIANITYTPGGTSTAAALTHVIDNVFQPANGLRPNSAKIVVLVTDGRSDDSPATVEAAGRLRYSGATITAVGVGEFLDKQELRLVVSEPQCVYTQYVSNFDTLPGVAHQTVLMASQEPVRLTPTSYMFQCGSDINLEVLPQTSGVTVEIKTFSGALAVYGSPTNSYIPSEALYEFNETALTSSPLVIHVRDTSRLLLAIRNVTSSSCTTYFAVEVKVGNHLRINDRMLCVAGGLMSDCGFDDFTSSPFIITDTPSPSIAALLPCQGADMYRAAYPGQPTRFLFCSSGKLIVVSCEQGQHFDASSYSSRPTTTATPMPQPTKRCPEHQHWSPLANRCLSSFVHDLDRNEDLDIPNPCVETGPYADLQFYEFPGDHTRYIHCDQYGDAYLKYCPKNTVWVQHSRSCAVGYIVG
ncbi:uncharacterized protein LOC128223355 [Mya arenaria]|uniref:uncharacterized protein LOC128223355 n=1 Tax=Mya arenaria TaxID=6604 RepID=UPI0022E6AC62|nr:uncharacterized protein LOC128223355 [Mya arenaria]